jgi:hypothetical protein
MAGENLGLPGWETQETGRGGGEMLVHPPFRTKEGL